MNQNKSNVPVSVAEEPDELSYYHLTLLSFLRESHPDLADDESFVATRSEQAAEAFSAAVRSGLTYDDAAQQANALLFQGLHFSPLDTLVTVLWNEFAAEVPEGSARSVALQLLPECRKVFAGYTLSDDHSEADASQWSKKACKDDPYPLILLEINLKNQKLENLLMI